MKFRVETTLRDDRNSYRFHVFRERGRLAAAIRPVPRTKPTLDELYGPHQEGIRETLTKIAQLPRGLVVVTGPTASGRTTTCYAMMEIINRTQARRIVVLEEHLSYDFDSKKSLVTQRNVGDDVPSYEQGAFWAFHEDLDIIYISELRTVESVQYALALAETGHLVFVTLHVPTVSEAITRLIDVFPGPRETMQRTLARALTAVIAQQLVPRDDKPGRIAINEVLLMTPQIRELIETEQTDFTAEIKSSREAGMMTMDDALTAACAAGLITEETTRSRLTDPSHLL